MAISYTLRNKGTSLHLPKYHNMQRPSLRNLAPKSKFAPIKVQSEEEKNSICGKYPLT